MERIDQVDAFGQVISTRTKQEWREEFFNHRAALVIPRTSNGRFLLAKRSTQKEPFPGVWVCGVGGTCMSGERFLEAAMREMKEEIGCKATLIPVNTFQYDEDGKQAIFRVFTTEEELDVDKLMLNEEAQYLQAFSERELRDLIQRHPKSCAPTAVHAIRHFLLGVQD